MFRRLLTKQSIQFRIFFLLGPHNAVQGFVRGIPRCREASSQTKADIGKPAAAGVH